MTEERRATPATRESTAAKVRKAKPERREQRASGVPRDNEGPRAPEETPGSEGHLEKRETGERLGWMDVQVWMVNWVLLDRLVRGVILGNRVTQEEMVYQDREGCRAPPGLSDLLEPQGHLVKQAKMENQELQAKRVRTASRAKTGERVTKEKREQPEETVVMGSKGTAALLGLQDYLDLRGPLECLVASVLLDRWCMLKALIGHQSQVLRARREHLVYLGSRELWEPEERGVHLASKVTLEIQERTGCRANLGHRWTYRGPWPTSGSRCLT